VTGFVDDPSLAPLWPVVRTHLDRNGLDWRGTVPLPDLLPEGRRRLGVILDRRISRDRRKVCLADLETGLRRLGAVDLVDVLRDQGHPPAGRRESARMLEEQTGARRAALDAACHEYLRDEPWVEAWSRSAWTDGLFARRDPAQVRGLVKGVRDVLAAAGTGRSRTDVAARLLGDAHALDSSTRLSRLVTRALAARDGEPDERTAWERAGMPLDLVSAPVLAWGLPLAGDAGPAAATRSMTAAGLPLHLSVRALRAQPLRVTPGTPVLVVENPRLVEAAAHQRLPGAVLCTNGNPTTAPTEAIADLRRSGARLRYHGDFDAAGLAITARAHAVGCAPFLMSAGDYRAAVAAAGDVDLPRDPRPAPPTPWDPDLAVAFDDRRLVVHQERVMDEVLRAHAAGT
jgi:uncharacterized protein (TIGR02679 family)